MRPDRCRKAIPDNSLIGVAGMADNLKVSHYNGGESPRWNLNDPEDRADKSMVEHFNECDYCRTEASHLTARAALEKHGVLTPVAAR